MYTVSKENMNGFHTRYSLSRVLSLYKIPRLITVGLIAATLWCIGLEAHAETYYVRQQNGQIFNITERYAQDLAADHWEIWYFMRGTNPSANTWDKGHWGSDSSKDLSTLL